jgi:hypothetical protein
MNEINTVQDLVELWGKEIVDSHLILLSPDSLLVWAKTPNKFLEGMTPIEAYQKYRAMCFTTKLCK